MKDLTPQEAQRRINVLLGELILEERKQVGAGRADSKVEEIIKALIRCANAVDSIVAKP